eukprot:1806087-Prymnesium_polylepis.2
MPRRGRRAQAARSALVRGTAPRTARCDRAASGRPATSGRRHPWCLQRSRGRCSAGGGACSPGRESEEGRRVRGG